LDQLLGRANLVHIGTWRHVDPYVPSGDQAFDVRPERPVDVLRSHLLSRMSSEARYLAPNSMQA
jgi:hypothetical protein